MSELEEMYWELKDEIKADALRLAEEFATYKGELDMPRKDMDEFDSDMAMFESLIAEVNKKKARLAAWKGALGL